MSTLTPASYIVQLQTRCARAIDEARDLSSENPQWERLFDIWKRCKEFLTSQLAAHERAFIFRERKSWLSGRQAKNQVQDYLFERYKHEKKMALDHGVERLCAHFGQNILLLNDERRARLRKALFLIPTIERSGVLPFLTFEFFDHFLTEVSQCSQQGIHEAFEGLLEMVSRFPPGMSDASKHMTVALYSRYAAQLFSLYTTPLEDLEDKIQEVRSSVCGWIDHFIHGGEGCPCEELTSFFRGAQKRALGHCTSVFESKTSLLERITEELPEKIGDLFREKMTVSRAEHFLAVVHLLSSIRRTTTVPDLFLEHIVTIADFSEERINQSVALYEQYFRQFQLLSGNSSQAMALLMAASYYPDNLAFFPLLAADKELEAQLLRHPWSEYTPLHLQSMFLFLDAGGDVSHFCALTEICGFAGVLPLSLLRPEVVGSLQRCAIDQLKKVFLLPDRLSIADKISILDNEPLIQFMSRFRKGDASFSTLCSVWSLLKTAQLKPGMMHKTAYDQVKQALDVRERCHLLTGTNVEELTIDDFYDLEKGDRLKEVVQYAPLSFIPIEPLIRYLASQPTEEIATWLQAMIATSDDYVQRVDTISEAQRKQILRRFRQYSSPLPPDAWLRLFSLDEQTAFDICHTPIMEVSLRDQRLHAQLQQRIDPRDPASLFQAIGNFSTFKPCREKIFSMITDLLLTAKEETICGVRNYLVWGDSSVHTGLCAACDSQFLFTRLDGDLVSLYQWGMLSGPLFPVAPFSLRRRLIEVVSDTGVEDFLRRSVTGRDVDEVWNEVDRIVDYLEESYPFLDPLRNLQQAIARYGGELLKKDAVVSDSWCGAGSDVACDPANALWQLHRSFVTTSAWHESRSLLVVLRALYQHITQSPHFSVRIDEQSRSEGAAYCLISLLILARYSEVTEEKHRYTVSISPQVHYIIQCLDAEKMVPLPRDNPQLSPQQFFSCLSGYSLHTPTPISPSPNLGPGCFASLVRSVQELTAENFYGLCARSLALRSVEDSPITQYIELFKKEWPKGSSLDVEGEMSLEDLLDHYLSFVSERSVPLSPNSMYFFHPRAWGQFSKASEIPVDMRSEGNFASAICRLFTPVIPQNHDGNCCIESLLMAVHGKIVYEGVEGRERLHREIISFRLMMVEFGKKHEQKLREAIGGDDWDLESVDRFLSFYDQPPYIEWTSPAVFWCASNLLQRPIRIFSRISDYFSTDDQGRLIPSSVFDDGLLAGGRPIDLFYWGESHYCLLLSR